MKNNIAKFLFGMAVMAFVPGISQQGHFQMCNTFEAMEQYFSAHPEARARFEASQKILNDGRLTPANISAKASTAATYTIPVVFHVLYECEAENVPDSKIVEALQQVNDDYSRNSADTNTIFTPFKSLYVDCGFKFVLAKTDNNGNCTSGIVHLQDHRTYWEQDDYSYYNGITWDPTKYLNIIIVKDIIEANPSSISGGQVGGYTWLPGTWPAGAPQDAIVYSFNMLSGYGARALSHEIGHWLNLSHTFGNTNNPGVSCGDDNVADTPPTKGNFSSCPSASTNTAITCATAPTPTTPYYQNVENIMDYSNCAKNFTKGQADRMLNTLTVTPSVSNRINLWSSTNLVNTGVANTATCVPVANFLASNCVYTLCAGSSIVLNNHSYNGPTSSLQWSGSNGVVFASPTATSTSASFPNVGVSDVTLTVNNSAGSNTVVRQITVISGTPGVIGTFTESFESGPVPTHWSVTNNNTGTSAWEQTYDASLDGIASFYINGSNCNAKDQDYLNMPTMDVVNSPNKLFRFAYAYAQSDITQDDELRVQGSKDCGGTWSNIVVLSGSQMQAGSGGVLNAPFAPTSPGEWKTYTLSTAPGWNPFKNSSSVMVRFNFVEGTGPNNGKGNNIYIDAINFSSSNDVGVNELTKSYNFNVYPNPTNGETTVRFNLNDAANVKLRVTDILGNEVMPVLNSNSAAGEQTVSINKNSSLSPGIYFLSLEINGAKMTSKLVVE